MFAAVGVAAVVLGWVGMSELLARRTPGGYNRWDVPYYVMQLFVLGSDPLQNGGPYPWQLELARFLAPLFTLLTVVETGRVLLAEEVNRLRSRTARRHVVVCGNTPFARELARQLLVAGHRVVAVRSEPLRVDATDTDRLLCVPGDATVPAVLRDAGVRRARYVYVCGADDEVNHAVAIAVRDTLVDLDEPPWIYVQLNRQQECQALQARRLGAASANRFRLDYFHVDDVAARTLYRLHPLAARPGEPLRIVIAGDSTFRGVLLVETARFWRARTDIVAGDLSVAVVGPDAERLVADLVDRYRFLAQTCRIEPYERDLTSWLAQREPEQRYERLYLCYADEQYNLDMALTRPDLWHATAGTIFVVTYRYAALAEAFHGRREVDLLDEVNHKIQIFPVTTNACDAGAIADDLTERLARQIHQRYQRAAGGRSGPPADGWSQLSESTRNANRAQVQGIAEKIQLLGCVIAVRRGGQDDAYVTEAEIERLARLEHDRWQQERHQQGWRFGAVRDDQHRRHPDLVAWHELSEDGREKARDAVRWLADILAEEGFTLVRLEPSPVRQR